MDRDRLMEGWCSGPAIHQGHKVACILERDHNGDCATSQREVREHLNGGQAACVRNNCGDRIPSGVEHHNVFDDRGECNG